MFNRNKAETFSFSEVDESGHELHKGDHVHGTDKAGKKFSGIIRSIDEKTHDIVVVDAEGHEHHCKPSDLHDDD